MADAASGRAAGVVDRDYHDWLTLHARQLTDRIGRLRGERRWRRGLPSRSLKLLLDSIDELARTRELLAAVEAGATEAELRRPYPDPDDATQPAGG